MNIRRFRIFFPGPRKIWRFRGDTFLLLSFTLTLLLATSLPLPTLAQSLVGGFGADYRFGEVITFTARVQSDSPVASARIFIQNQGQPDTIVAPVEVSPGGELKYSYELTALQPGQYPPRAFSKITVRFQGTLENGETFASNYFDFDYVDNRFSWKERENGLIHVHWYLGDDAFVQYILDAANQGLEKAREILPPLALKRDVNFYVYASSAEMQAALAAGPSWIAGQTLAPDLGVMVVSIPPERLDTRLEIKRQVPHELMHTLLYQYQGNGYENIPTWLNEGLATWAELSPNPDYPSIVDHAVQNKTLIPVAELCRPFSSDSSLAQLEYAESKSFTSYLYQQYGTAGLEKLVGSYSGGMDCQRGIEAALGSSLDQLENKWKEESLGVNAFGKAVRELLPWIALFSIIVFIPLLVTFSSLSKRSNPSGLEGGRNPGQV